MHLFTLISIFCFVFFLFFFLLNKFCNHMQSISTICIVYLPHAHGRLHATSHKITAWLQLSFLLLLLFLLFSWVTPPPIHIIFSPFANSFARLFFLFMSLPDTAKSAWKTVSLSITCIKYLSRQNVNVWRIESDALTKVEKGQCEIEWRERKKKKS